MTHCEHCQVSDSDKEVRLSDIAPNTWLCQNCFELDPHHSDWETLKKRPYNEYHNINLYVEMSREAIEHVVEVLGNDLNDADLDLENNSISDIQALREYLYEVLEK